MVVVKEYRYLGMLMTDDGRSQRRREDLMSRAKRSFWRAWGMGMREGELSSWGAASLWEVLVRPVLEYGAELEVTMWEEAERLQRRAGRMVLGVWRSVANEVVLGDLGWWTLEGRRVLLMLVYWGKVVSERRGVVWEVYKEGHRVVLEGGGRGSWVYKVRGVMEEVGLKEEWESQKVCGGSGWRSMVKMLVGKWEERRWVGRMCSRPKLARYMRIKTVLRKEWFLKSDRCWVRRWVGIRAGGGGLQVEQGRYRGVVRRERVCKCCELLEVEDLDHLVMRCDRWKEERRRLWDRLREIDMKMVRLMSGWGGERVVDWLLGGANRKMGWVVMKEMGKWIHKREGRLVVGEAMSRRGEVMARRREVREAEREALAGAIEAVERCRREEEEWRRVAREAASRDVEKVIAAREARREERRV